MPNSSQGGKHAALRKARAGEHSMSIADARNDLAFRPKNVRVYPNDVENHPSKHVGPKTRMALVQDSFETPSTLVADKKIFLDDSTVVASQKDAVKVAKDKFVDDQNESALCEKVNKLPSKVENALTQAKAILEDEEGEAGWESDDCEWEPDDVEPEPEPESMYLVDLAGSGFESQFELFISAKPDMTLDRVYELAISCKGDLMSLLS